MEIIRSASTLGSTIETAELVAPNRALDHFSAGYIDRTATRALATSYQAGTTARLVAAIGNVGTIGDTLGIATAATDAPPSVIRARNFTPAAGGPPVVVGLVPPGHYYRLIGTGTMALTAVYEVDL